MTELNAAAIFGGPSSSETQVPVSVPVTFSPFPTQESKVPDVIPVSIPMSVQAPSYPTAPTPTFTPASSPSPVQQDRIYQAGNAEFQFGQKVNRWPINRFKGIAERVQRISLIDLSAWDGKRVHFVDSVKSFIYCYAGSCCKTGKQATVNYFGPVLVYTTSSDGMTVIDKKFSVEFMSLSDEKYNNLLTIWNLLRSRGLNLNQVDLLVTGKNKNTGSSSFVDISFTEAGPAIWLQYEDLKSVIWAEYQRVKSFIPTSFARSMGSTLEECEVNYSKIVSMIKGQTGTPVQQPSVNPAFNLASLANPNLGQPK